MIRQSLPLPSERLLERNSVDAGLRVRTALAYLDSIDSPIDIWREASHIEGNADPVPSILSVDTVAFRPNITIDESGRVEGADGIGRLESPDLFTQFVLDPDAFRGFLAEHFDRAYTSLFVYQIQPIDPKFTC
jgi:hypothetical protein